MAAGPLLLTIGEWEGCSVLTSALISPHSTRQQRSLTDNDAASDEWIDAATSELSELTPPIASERCESSIASLTLRGVSFFSRSTIGTESARAGVPWSRREAAHCRQAVTARQATHLTSS